MKKSPIDDLFARKLADWESQPSAAAWERIQARQRKPKRRPVYWLAAAMILLALFAGYLAWQSPYGQEMGQEGSRLSANTKPTAAPSAAPESAPLPQSEQDRDEATEAAIASALLPAALPRAVEVATAEVRVEPVAVGPFEAQEPLKSEVLIAKAEEPLITTEQVAEVAPSPLVQKMDNEPARVVIAHVTLPEEDTKPSKMLRMLRQLKNLKEGEEVNWEETGIAPKRLIARADSKLRDQEEKISKRYQQFKELTQF